ncbi:NADPH:quinone reductase [Methylobacterium sp. ap11]|uniref:NADP-dependent oxidoreductase n=1 Tax=Methylobacterium sp. ap11 TaxID=1761799 RepID=UPI0008D89B3E|nr:NADP-dependent oxidoreductase [Methylobacterium sp. ap11]SEP48189.1 NADPH:quinone reductase [Methylobacterium sp. ap11]
MKALILDRYKKKQPLRLGEMPEPAVGDRDVLVAVAAAGLNPLDAKIRDGEFKPLLKYRPPFVLGHDLAGTVIRVGRNVRRFKVGDEVYARPRDGRIGALAERIAVDEADLALKPGNLSMAEAASIPLVGLTAWQALVQLARVKPGDQVLIHAGAGDVGTFAIQLAKHLGATVATTTSAGNADLVKRLGADLVIDYRRQDFEKVLNGYDVVLASLDGETLHKSLDVLRRGGKLISLSGPPDPAFAKAAGLNVVLALVMRLLSLRIRRRAKARGVTYSFLYMRANGAQLAGITKLVEAGAIRPVIDRVVLFEATDRALAELGDGRTKGKVVIEVSSGASA